METPPVTIKKTALNSLTKTCLTPCRRVGLGRPSSGSFKKSAKERTLNTPLHSDSFQATNQDKFVMTPHDKTPISACSNESKVPLSEAQNKNADAPRVRRCLTQDLKTSQLQKGKRTYDKGDVENHNTAFEKGDNKQNYSFNNETKKIKSKQRLLLSNEEVRQTPETGSSTGWNIASFKTPLDVIPIEKDQEIADEVIVQLASSLLEKKRKLELLRVQETYAKKHNLEELRSQTYKWQTAGQEALRHCVSVAKKAGYSITIHQLMAQHGFPPELMGYNAEDDDFE